MLRQLLLISSICALAALTAGGAGASTPAAVGTAMEGPQIGLVLVSPAASTQTASPDVAAQRPLELRAILGAPGAAVLSAAIALPETITGIWIAPRQAFALVTQGADVSTSVVTVRALAASTPQPITGALAQPDAVAFGPSGRTAALYSTASGRVQVITGLPASPRTLSDYTLPMPSGIRFLTVSDDGSAVLAGAEDNNVYLLAPSGSANLIHTAGKLAALTFLPGRLDAALVDSGQSLLIVLRGVGGSPTPVVVASHLSGLQDDLSLGFPDSPDVLLLSNPAAKQALVVNLASLQTQSFPTSIRPSMLQPLQHANQFALSASSGNSAWVFEYRPEGSRVYFASLLNSSVGTK